MKYKFIATILFVITGLFTLEAQYQEKTLLKETKLWGGFGGPMFTISRAGGDWGGGSGGGGAVIMDHFFLGGFGQRESFGSRRFDGENYELEVNYGGIWLGLVTPSHKMVHSYFSMKLGSGTTRYDQRGNGGVYASDGVFVVMPEAGVEVNINRWFRLAATGGFRFVGGFGGLDVLKNTAFNSPVLGFTLRFGGFGFYDNYDNR
jgi:hypothetical protein